MKHYWTSLVSTLFIVGSLIGCGGSGSGSSSNAIAGSAFRSQVATTVEEGFSALRAGSGYGAPGSRLATRNGGATFNDYYGLWQLPVENGSDFFVDEALTDAAGTERLTYTNNESGSFEFTGSLQLTKGLQAGLTSTSSVTYANLRLEYSFTGTSPDLGNFSTTGYAEDGTVVFSTRVQKGDDPARTYQATYRPDGTSTVEFNSDSLFDYVLNFDATGAGTGTITGNNSALPATVTWNSEGDGEVRFSDGSTLSFTNFDFVQI